MLALARSTLDLLSILRRLTSAGAKFKSLKDPWADTTTPHGELMVTILAGLATFERHLIKARTDEGRTRAKGRGVRFGRPPKLTSYQRAEALQRLAAGESQADVARAYNVPSCGHLSACSRARMSRASLGDCGPKRRPPGFKNRAACLFPPTELSISRISV